MIPRKKIDSVRNMLRKMLIDLDKEILDEFEDEDQWGFVIKHGNYAVLIIHPKKVKFMVVVFPLRIEDERILGTLKTVTEDHSKSGKFYFSLKSAISTPVTGYRFHKTERGEFAGFSIERRIFPFHENFTIKDLEEAIQSVVSAGVMGQTFLSIIIGEKELEQKIEERKTEPPDEMYI